VDKRINMPARLTKSLANDPMARGEPRGRSGPCLLRRQTECRFPNDASAAAPFFLLNVMHRTKRLPGDLLWPNAKNECATDAAMDKTTPRVDE
jgi:hypothetical protein